MMITRSLKFVSYSLGVIVIMHALLLASLRKRTCEKQHEILVTTQTVNNVSALPILVNFNIY